MAPTDDTIKDFEEYGNKWLWPVMLKRFSDTWVDPKFSGLVPLSAQQLC